MWQGAIIIVFLYACEHAIDAYVFAHALEAAMFSELSGATLGRPRRGGLCEGGVCRKVCFAPKAVHMWANGCTNCCGLTQVVKGLAINLSDLTMDWSIELQNAILELISQLSAEWKFHQVVFEDTTHRGSRTNHWIQFGFSKIFEKFGFAGASWRLRRLRGIHFQCLRGFRERRARRRLFSISQAPHAEFLGL